MFGFDPKSLTDSRCQLHWASQLLSAAADAKLPKADDDSHSNLAWNEQASQLEGRAGVSFNVVDFSIAYGGDSFSLTNQTLADGASWLGERLQAEINFRDYEMPEHGVGKGGAFTPMVDHLNAIARWFSFGKKMLSGYGDLRIWPHHFDLGFWNPTEVEGRSIGGGFSLGDNHFDQPYFYINPYGIDRPEALPDLAHGSWTELWVGAVLTAEDLEQGDASHVAKHFVDEAVSLSRELLK